MIFKKQSFFKSIVLLGVLVLMLSAISRGEETVPSLPTPVRQSTLTHETAGEPLPLTLRDAARDNWWFGVGIRHARWAPDSSCVFFHWTLNPGTDKNSRPGSWFRVDPAGTTVRQVPLSEVHLIPAPTVSWCQKGKRAAWINAGNLYLYDAEKKEPIRQVFNVKEWLGNPLMHPDGGTVQFMVGEDLFQYNINSGSTRQLTRKHKKKQAPKTKAARWFRQQQKELFKKLRAAEQRRETFYEHWRKVNFTNPQPIPVEGGAKLENIRLSPDRRYITFRLRKSHPGPPRKYMDYVTVSGYTEVKEDIPKVGESQDELRMGIVAFDPSRNPEEVDITWVDCKETEGKPAIIFGPYWSLEGDQVLVQIVSSLHKDRWISRLDIKTGKTTPIIHDHDDAWLGGPPPLPGGMEPGLFKWLPGGRFVFTSERTGWCHLYLAEKDGTVHPLTRGAWEVRRAQLNRERTQWLITASREHPCDDHLYTLPAAGGELVQLTTKPGRHIGILAPDGKRLAVIYSESIQLPDLFLRDTQPDTPGVRVTVSGTDNYYRHRWVRPGIVSFPHPDGKPVWAALFKPGNPGPNQAAILHIHGGGYRQFSHRGWSVYGYSLHIGLINYLVQQGYTVLDLDYRGSSGFGRDYRTDIYRSMGIKDVDSAAAAVDYLVDKHGIERSRLGLYGISYGGMFTLMALFRYPGIFAAGVANAAVSDCAHYSHPWMSRVLNLPYDDPEAYQTSSPIYHAAGLQDPLLIVHGLIDDNVHFQDAARLVQKLIELEKEFEVMFYPAERHVIAAESSRYDYYRRLTAFFQRHLGK
jgi:dipeptidyl aminopeptidase/acylaminoacyl peptidase